MAKVNLEKMNLGELQSLEKEVQLAIKNFEKKKRAEARAAIEAVAKEHGLSLNDILGKNASGRGPKAVPKYRNPKDPTQTWSGRGRQPAWFKAALKAGKSQKSLEI